MLWSLFKRSWRARALLNIAKIRHFGCSYLFISLSIRLRESQRYSEGLRNSQRVSASLSESQPVSASLSKSQRVSVNLSEFQSYGSHRIKLMKLIWTNKVDLKWSIYFLEWGFEKVALGQVAFLCFHNTSCSLWTPWVVFLAIHLAVIFTGTSASRASSSERHERSHAM